MKKLIFLLLCTATLGLVSCKKDTIVQQLPGKTYNFTIQPDQWVLSADKLNYTYEWKNSAIKDFTVDDDGVLVYLSHPINSSSYIQLPFVYDVDAYSYELFVGGIALDIQSSDYQATQPVKPTRPVLVKVVIIPSEYAGN